MTKSHNGNVSPSKILGGVHLPTLMKHKRFWTVFLVVVLITSMIPTNLFAEQLVSDSQEISVTADDTSDDITVVTTEPAQITLTGKWSEDLVAAARAEVGQDASVRYTSETESDTSSLFAAKCLEISDISSDTVHYQPTIADWETTLADNNEYQSEQYNPVSGDIVFIDSDDDKTSDNIGIVSGYDSENHMIVIRVLDNVVQELALLDTETMMGAIDLPENPNSSEADLDSIVIDKSTDETQLSEETKSQTEAESATEETETDTIESEDIIELSEQTLTCRVGLFTKFTATGYLPECAKLSVKKLSDNDIDYIADTFNLETGSDNYAYDIKILDADDNEFDATDINIRVSGLNAKDDETAWGYHLVDVDVDTLHDVADPDIESILVEVQDGDLVYDANGFSIMFLSKATVNSVENVIIDKFKINFVSGASVDSVYTYEEWNTNTNTWETKTSTTPVTMYQWNPTDKANGHSFVYRVNYTFSGVQTIPANAIKITLPLHILRGADGNWADTFDCPYLLASEVTDQDNPDFVYTIDEELNTVTITNVSELTTGLSGYIEFSYSTTKDTTCYPDMAISDAVNGSIDITKDAETVSANASAGAVAVNTHATISSTSKESPIRYTSWQSVWGTAPTDANQYYYLVYPIWSYINKNTSKYYIQMDDTFTDLSGSVVAYKFSGYNWQTSNRSSGTYSDYGWRYDYVLVKYSKSEADELLANNLSSGDMQTYTVYNTVVVTVDPVDQIDSDTTAQSSRSWTYEAPTSYKSPTGNFSNAKYGLYGNGNIVEDSEDITSYKLAEFLSGSISDISGIQYCTSIYGNPYPWTVESGYTLTNTVDDVSHYAKRQVKFSIEDDTFSIKALSYNNKTDSGSIVSSDSGEFEVSDYDINQLRWNISSYEGYYDEDELAFDSRYISTYSQDLTGAGDNNVYFDIKDADGNWTNIGYYDLEEKTYNLNSGYVSDASGSTINFNDGVKGYRIYTTNAYYYTTISAYPSLTLHRSDNIAKIFTGNSDAVASDLAALEKDKNNQPILTKIAVTNTACGKVSLDDSILYANNRSGTDYIKATERHSTLKKQAVASENDKSKKLYKITWQSQLAEVYSDDNGEHYIPQESGTFYDLLPDGASFDVSSLNVSAGSITLYLNSDYTYQLTNNYKNTGRTLLTVNISESTNTSYNLSYQTIHAWPVVKDYGELITNNIAYKTGNDDIADGQNDGLMGVTVTDGNSDKKMLYADASFNIDAIIAANTGLYKKVKTASDVDYSYKSTVYTNEEYSYYLRYANDSNTTATNIILMDSIENFVQFTGIAGESGGGIASDWKGTLTGIDVSQMEAAGVAPVVYVLTTDNINPNDYWDAANEKIDLSSWTVLTDDIDLSTVHAIAIDCTKAADGSDFKLGKDESLSAVLYMKAPASVTSECTNPVTYNNIYCQRTAFDASDETDPTPVTEFYHQDYTQLQYRVVADVPFIKLSSEDGSAIKNAEYRLYGTSYYDTSVDETLKSGKDGTFTFKNLERGTYTLQEIDSTNDWLLNTDTYTVTIAYDGTISITNNTVTDSIENGQELPYKLYDDPRVHADIRFIKTDSISLAGLKDAEFRLSGTSDYGTDIIEFATSGDTGYVVFSDIEMGTYDLTEITAPVEHILNTNKYKVVVSNTGMASIYLVTDSGTYEPVDAKNGSSMITNEPLHDFSFVKTSTYGTNIRIANVKFSLTGVSDYGTEVSLESTSSDADGTYGFVEFTDLEPGTYILKEIDTSEAKDNSGLNDGKGLTYTASEKAYTVIIKSDDTFEILNMPTTDITYQVGDETETITMYDFQNTPTGGQIHVQKLWNGGDVSKLEKNNIDITLQTDEPSVEDYDAFQITFNANGGTFTDKSESNTVIYSSTDGLIIGTNKYMIPESDFAFLGWSTSTTGETIITVDENGIPTSYDWDGSTLTLYAIYESPNMKYAVRLYGIEADVDENNNTLGLTFGPATGESYLELGNEKTGVESAEYGAGNGYVAHVSKQDYENGATCLHWMSWNEIAELASSNPHMFDECLEAGCTHSVYAEINSTIGWGYSAGSLTGDGYGMFDSCLRYEYERWNYDGTSQYGLTIGGWAISRIRYTLNGWNGTDSTTYSNPADKSYLCDETNSLLSCFESSLRNNIVAASKVSSTGNKSSSNLYYNASGAKTTDKLWLFSYKELYGGTDSRYTISGENPQYEWLSNNNVTTSNYSLLKSYGQYGLNYWWTRSASTDGGILLIYTDGGLYSEVAFYSRGVAPGFCLGRAE